MGSSAVESALSWSDTCETVKPSNSSPSAIISQFANCWSWFAKTRDFKRGLTEGGMKTAEVWSFIFDLNVNEKSQSEVPELEFTTDEELSSKWTEIVKKNILRIQVSGPVLIFTQLRTLKNDELTWRLCLHPFLRCFRKKQGLIPVQLPDHTFWTWYWSWKYIFAEACTSSSSPEHSHTNEPKILCLLCPLKNISEPISVCDKWSILCVTWKRLDWF